MPTIIVRDAGHALALRPGADDTTRFQVRPSLAVLARNGWVVTRWQGGTLRLQPGERVQKIRRP